MDVQKMDDAIMNDEAMKQRIENVYVADGLADDFEELILKCSQVAKLSFEKFSDIWKEMDFSCLFHGRPSGSELAEFCEEALQISKQFMVSNINNNFEKSVAGLFLLYGILNLQPYARLIAVRIVQEDVSAVLKLEYVARKERRHDILYILGEILIRGPCQFHLSERERGLEYCLRKYFDGASQHSVLGRKPSGVFHRHNAELEIVRNLTQFEDSYDHAKRKLTMPAGQREPDRSLGYSNNRLAKDLQSSLKTVVSGVVVSDRADPARPPTPDRSDAVQAVKNKAMRNIVNPVKHLSGIKDRKKKLNKKPNKKPKESPLKPKTKKCYKRTAFRSSASLLKSPNKRYPWCLKMLNEFEEEEDPLYKHKPYNKIVTTASTSEPLQPAQSFPMTLFEPVDLTNTNEEDLNQPNTPKSYVRQSPRKNATPRQTRMISFGDSSDDQPDVLTPKSKSKKTDTNPTEFIVPNTKPQFIELPLNEIPIEISSENNDVEIEIIDLYACKQNMETVMFSNNKRKEFRTYSKKKQSQVVKIETLTSKTNDTSCEVKSNTSSPKLNIKKNQNEVIISNEPSTSKITQKTNAVKSSSKRKQVKSNKSILKLHSDVNQIEVIVSNETSTSKASQKTTAAKSNEGSPKKKQVKANESSLKLNSDVNQIEVIVSNEQSTKKASQKRKAVKSNDDSPKKKQVKSNESSPKVNSNVNQSQVIISNEPSTKKTSQKITGAKSNEGSPKKKQVKSNVNQSEVIEPPTKITTQKKKKSKLLAQKSKLNQMNQVLKSIEI